MLDVKKYATSSELVFQSNCVPVSTSQLCHLSCRYICLAIHQPAGRSLITKLDELMYIELISLEKSNLYLPIVKIQLLFFRNSFEGLFVCCYENTARNCMFITKKEAPAKNCFKCHITRCSGRDRLSFSLY